MSSCSSKLPPSCGRVCSRNVLQKPKHVLGAHSIVVGLPISILYCCLLTNTYVAPHFLSGFPGVVPFLQAMILMITVCHVILRLPRHGTYWLFEMCEKILYLAVQAVPVMSQAFSFLPSGKFPRDIRSAMKSLTLEGKTEDYAACPVCLTIYCGLQRDNNGDKATE